MNIIKSEFESNLKLEKLLFTNISFSRTEDSIDCNELNLRVGRKIDKSEDKVKVTLIVKILSEDQSLSLEITATAVFGFSFGEKISKKMKDDILEKNTVAIMFPYVRSQVSLVTSQPDMAPIVIPAINIDNLLSSNQDETEDNN